MLRVWMNISEKDVITFLLLIINVLDQIILFIPLKFNHQNFAWALYDILIKTDPILQSQFIYLIGIFQLGTPI